jgi:hypothetical protein
VSNLPPINVEVLRSLLLDGNPVHITKMRVAGKLDLADCSGVSGAVLPPLVLEGCDIPDEIDISFARLSRFSVEGSSFTKILARGVRVEGPFDFSRGSGYGEPPEPGGDSIAWIDARGARIEGDLDGRGAHLRLPMRDPSEILPGKRLYALGLGNCVVEGRIMLTDGFRAVGGVNLSDGDVRGEVWLRGAYISAIEGDSFSGQSTRFGSLLAMDEGFKASGQISLVGAKISGTLQCSRATFSHQTPDCGGSALAAGGAEIGGDVRFDQSAVRGQINLAGIAIDGGLECTNATFFNRRDDGAGISFTMQDAKVGGSIYLGGEKFKAHGLVDLSGAKIAGSMFCEAARFYNRTRDGAGVALAAQFTNVGGSAYLRQVNAHGQILFKGAKIAGDLDGHRARFRNMIPRKARARLDKSKSASELGTLPYREPDIFTFDVSSAEVGGNLTLSEAVSFGHISMWGLHVGRNFEARNALLACSGFYVEDVFAAFQGRSVGPNDIFARFAGSNLNFAVVGPHAHIAGDLILTGCTILGNLDLPNAEVGGAFRCEGLRFVTQYPVDQPKYERTYSRLNLKNARIGAELVVKSLAADLPVHVDLSGATVGTIDDEWPGGWGGTADGSTRIRLNLDGFTYERVRALKPDPPPSWIARRLEPLCGAYLWSAERAGKLRALTIFDIEERKKMRAEIAESFEGPRSGKLAEAIADVFSRRPSAREHLAWLDLQKDSREWGRSQIVRWVELQVQEFRLHVYRPASQYADEFPLPANDGDDFRPQPYRHLTRVFRTQGYEDAAREIAIEEAWKAPSGALYRIVKWIWGGCFGFGLSVKRAAWTLVIFFLLTWGFVQAAIDARRMVLTVSPVASLLVGEDNPQAAIQKGRNEPVVSEPRCTNQIVPPYYVIDLMLPAIPLHQETVCDIGRDYGTWRVLKYILSIFGKILTTLALITFSGVLKVRAESE